MGPPMLWTVDDDAANIMAPNSSGHYVQNFLLSAYRRTTQEETRSVASVLEDRLALVGLEHSGLVVSPKCKSPWSRRASVQVYARSPCYEAGFSVSPSSVGGGGRPLIPGRGARLQVSVWRTFPPEPAAEEYQRRPPHGHRRHGELGYARSMLLREADTPGLRRLVIARSCLSDAHGPAAES